MIAAKAKERQGARNDLNIPANLPGSENKETRDELAEMKRLLKKDRSERDFSDYF